MQVGQELSCVHLVHVQRQREGDSSASLVFLHESQNERAAPLGVTIIAVGFGQDEAELWVLPEIACKYTVKFTLLF